MEQVFDADFTELSITEDQVHQIVESFKDKLSIAAENWEEVLRDAVRENMINEERK